VKRPLWPVATMLGADERSTARLQAEQSSAEHASVDGRAGARTRHCVGSAGAVLRQRRRRMHPAHRDCCCCCCARLVASSCCANWAISLCDLTAAVGARNDDARQMSILSAATTPSVQPRLPDCAESAVWRRGVHGRTDTRRSGWGKASIARRRGGDASDGEDPHLTIASDAARSVEGVERTWTQSGLGNLIAEVRNAMKMKLNCTAHQRRTRGELAQTHKGLEVHVGTT
jgi:hypothetical protein